jgi:NAD(P)H-dependent FMN reductase
MAIQFAIINGSHRKQSESLRVSQYIEARILKKSPGATVKIISMAGNPLPLWDESVWDGDPKWQKTWKPISETLKASEAVIVVSPEWAGMAPAGLKNIFLFCTQGELAHKPGVIVTVSAGMGGAYPVNELRTSSYKNTQLCYLPDHVIVRKAGEMLKDADKPASHDDEMVRKRIDYSLDLLAQYALAFRQVRESGVVNLKDFPYGM